MATLFRQASRRHLCAQWHILSTRATASAAVAAAISRSTHRLSSACALVTGEETGEKEREQWLGLPPLDGPIETGEEERRRWLSLPPFDGSMDPSSVAKQLFDKCPPSSSSENGGNLTALKWVRRCCPHLPMSLVQKLFRLRQIRKELPKAEDNSGEAKDEKKQLKRVSAKDAMNLGDVIFLPITVQNFSVDRCRPSKNEDEVNFIRSLELYKDPAVIVINKPPGLPVQGGVGINHSIDVLAATSLKYDYSESPRLVHRLDRDSSGVLVLGRTQTSTSLLHSMFRERTSGASADDFKNSHRPLQRKYWALVIGTPRRSKGIISAPLTKIVLENGKSERLTVVENRNSISSINALTEYKVLQSSVHGFTWLELSPLTGRKHQLRVHCAEVLGTPIVGDLKYGWQTHRRWKPITWSNPTSEHRSHQSQKIPFGLELEGGSICEKQPRLHLHCREMVLPNISVVLQHMQLDSPNYDLSKLDRLNFVAPMPLHMQTSWSILDYEHDDI